MTVKYCALADVKQYGALNQQSDGALLSGRDDELLELLITAMSRKIDDYCQWSFFNESIAARVYATPRVVIDNDGILWVQTDKASVQSVSALAYKLTYAGAWTSIALSNVFVAALDGNIPPAGQHASQIGVDGSWSALRGTRMWVQASFIGGYAQTPSVIFEACRQLVWWQYKLREAVPTNTVGFPEMGMVVRPLDFPPHIQKMLREWRRI